MLYPSGFLGRNMQVFLVETCCIHQVFFVETVCAGAWGFQVQGNFLGQEMLETWQEMYVSI